MSRVTKLMKRPRRLKHYERPRKRVTHHRGRTIVFGPGRLSLNGVVLGTVTDVTWDFGASFQPLQMEMVPVRAP